jgi:SSS family solute:Na+ symporter
MYTQPEGTSVIPGVTEVFDKANGGIDFDRSYPWLISTFIPVGLKGWWLQLCLQQLYLH